MTLSLSTRGYLGGGGGGGASVPTISDITPIDGEITPGEPGAFSASFATARRTPIAFHLADIDGGEISISIKYADRNETYVARDVEGSWVWPFDVQSDNTFTDLGGGEADVSMLPRGGWPACVVEFKVAASAMAVQA